MGDFLNFYIPVDFHYHKNDLLGWQRTLLPLIFVPSYGENIKSAPYLPWSKGGPGLAFIVYPKVVSQMPAGGAVFSFLFFFMLITISLGSVFGAFETVMSAVTDQVKFSFQIS